MKNAFSQLLDELEGIPTSDIPLIEWHHKLCFLAVVMDEKPAFAIGFDQAVPPRLIHFLDQQAPLLGVKVFSTSRPPREYLKRARMPAVIALAIADRWDRSSQVCHSITWVTKRSENEGIVREAVAGEVSLGTALGYPTCCAEAYNADRALHLDMYYQALCDGASSTDRAELLVLIEKNDPIHAALPSADRVVATMGRFPFLPYIACGDCLKTDGSPAAQQNSKYASVLGTLSPDAARRMLILAKTMSQYGGGG